MMTMIVIIIIFIKLSSVDNRWQWFFFTCIQNMKLVTNKFESGGLHRVRQNGLPYFKG